MADSSVTCDFSLSIQEGKGKRLSQDSWDAEQRAVGSSSGGLLPGCSALRVCISIVLDTYIVETQWTISAVEIVSDVMPIRLSLALDIFAPQPINTKYVNHIRSSSVRLLMKHNITEHWSN